MRVRVSFYDKIFHYRFKTKGSNFGPFVAFGGIVATVIADWLPCWVNDLFVTNGTVRNHVVRLEKKVDKLMSQFQDLQDAVTEQTSAIGTLQTNVQEAGDRVAADVDTLKEQLAEALADKPDLTAILDGIKSNTQGIVEQANALGTLDPVVDTVVNSPETSDTVAEAPEGEPVPDAAPLDGEVETTDDTTPTDTTTDEQSNS